MTIGTDIYTALSGDGTVSGLVGNRIYPNWIPQDVTYPCVAYFSDGDDVENDLSGEASIAHHNYEFVCFASSYSGAQSLADAVKNALIAASTFKTYRLRQSDGYDPAIEIHSVSMDFSLWQ